MEDPSPQKSVIQKNWVGLVTKAHPTIEVKQMERVLHHHQMSGTSGGVDGGEPHLTTNGEVSIASEFNYDAGKYGSDDGARAAAFANSSDTMPYNNQLDTAAVLEHSMYLSPGSKPSGI